MTLSTKQVGVLERIAAAGLVTLALLAFAIFGPWPARLAQADLVARLSVALGCVTLMLLPLLLCIAVVARHRFVTPEDIDGSGLADGSAKVTLLRAILQNTLEQTVLAAGAQLAWAAVMPAFALAVLPAHCMLFLAGRAAFGHGYARGATGRAFGFALTFLPTVLMLLLSAGFAAAAAVRHVA